MNGKLCLLILLLFCSAGFVLAAGSPRNALTIEGNVERGRGIFNGLGGCYQCHGYDAFLSRRPKQPPKLAQDLARLNPPPANLRDPERLKAQTPKERLRSLKSGHPGTAMFPKKFLTERELADLLAYLATLRPMASPKLPPPPKAK
jgi:mono/diheme cytochrome c family protein